MIMKKITAIILTYFAIFAIQAQSVISIPFVLEGEHMTIKLKVNNTDSLLFVFDTGASTTVIDSATAEAISLKEISKTGISGASGNASYAVCQLDSILYKDLKLVNQRAVKASLASLSRSLGTEINGIIGADILRKYVTEINYDIACILLYKESSTVDFSNKGTSLPLNFSLGLSIPTVPVSIELQNGEIISGEFLLDNGAGITTCINTPHVNDGGLLQKAGKTFKSSSKGLSSKSGNYLAAAKSISFSGYTFSDIPFILEQSTQGVVSMRTVKGLLGNTILKRFNILLDYASQKVYIRPNDLFSTPFKFPLVGFKLEKVNKELIVADINFESEASKLGIKNGFILTAIDGKKNLTLKQARELLALPGLKTIEFVDVNKQIQKIVLKLERLI